MPSTDPVADLLTILRNASRARLDRTTAPDSSLSRAIIQVLQSEGFIKAWRASAPRGAQRRLEVTIPYGPKRELILNGTRRVSCPGRRVYIGLGELKPLLRRLEVPLLSTPQGIMTGAQALSRKTGGELVCVVW